jgi:hypothetical protein
MGFLSASLSQCRSHSVAVQPKSHSHSGELRLWETWKLIWRAAISTQTTSKTLWVSPHPPINALPELFPSALTLNARQAFKSRQVFPRFNSVATSTTQPVPTDRYGLCLFKAKCLVNRNQVQHNTNYLEAGYPNQLDPSGNFVENSTKLICLEITGYRIEYSTVKSYGCLELQIRRSRKV